MIELKDLFNCFLARPSNNGGLLEKTGKAPAGQLSKG